MHSRLLLWIGLASDVAIPWTRWVAVRGARGYIARKLRNEGDRGRALIIAEIQSISALQAIDQEACDVREELAIPRKLQALITNADGRDVPPNVCGGVASVDFVRQKRVIARSPLAEANHRLPWNALDPLGHLREPVQLQLGGRPEPPARLLVQNAIVLSETGLRV